MTLGAATTALFIDLGGGSDRLVLADGGNTVTVVSIETITGGTGDDTVIVQSGSQNGSVSLGAGTDHAGSVQ